MYISDIPLISLFPCIILCLATCHFPHSLRTSTSVRPHWLSGRDRAASASSSCQGMESASTTSSRCLTSSASYTPSRKNKKRPLDPDSVTPASRPTNRKRTSSVKSPTSSTRVPKRKSSKTLDRGSTTSAKGLLPFWNECSQALSNRLPSHTEIGCVDTGSNWSNSSSATGTRNSWSCNRQSHLLPSAESKNSQRISLPSSTSSSPGTMDSEQEPTAEKEKLKAVRIRVYPTKDQKKTLERWLGVCRWTYNQVVQAINSKAVFANKKAMRAAYVNVDNFKDKNQWVKDVPYDTRDEAMNDALKAQQAWNAKKKVNQKGGFHLKFRSRMDPVQSIAVLKKQWGLSRGPLSQIFSSTALQCHEKRYPLPKELDHDSRLLRDKNKRYFLCMPISRERRIPASNGKIVAIDPGVRTFITTYDQDGDVHEWGKGDQTQLYRLAIHVDRLNSKASKTRHSSRYRIKKAIGRIYDRIRNLVDDVHKKAAKWLCENHETILIPEFSSSGMTKKGERRIHTKAVRSMLHWSHYRFRQRLLFKATEYPGVRVQVVTEEFTSKTCGECGDLHQHLGGKKVFMCPSCKWTCDRDVNGARNILLKYLTEVQTSYLLGCESLGPSPLFLLPTGGDMHNYAKRAKLHS